MAKCTRCEQLPTPFPTAGRLYLVPPIAPTASLLENTLRKLELHFTSPHPHIYEVPFGNGDLHVLCEKYSAELGELEQADTKCLILPEGESLSISHMAAIEPLRALVGRIQGHWLTEMLAEDRLTSWFQPVVERSGAIHGYECLMRGMTRGGATIYPNEIYGTAQRAGLLFFLDRACRINSVRRAASIGISRQLFINFVPATIYRPETCLQTTFEAIEEVGLKPENIVFEVVESSEVRNVEHLLRVLSYYREHGFKVALDDLGAGFSSLNLLSRLQPDYIKMDMQLIRDVDTDPYKAAITENLLNMVHKLGVRCIAEGVETEGEWRWLLDHGADLIQGFLLGHPTPEPAQNIKLPK